MQTFSGDLTLFADLLAHGHAALFPHLVRKHHTLTVLGALARRLLLACCRAYCSCCTGLQHCSSCTWQGGRRAVREKLGPAGQFHGTRSGQDSIALADRSSLLGTVTQCAFLQTTLSSQQEPFTQTPSCRQSFVSGTRLQTVTFLQFGFQELIRQRCLSCIGFRATCRFINGARSLVLFRNPLVHGDKVR